KLRPLRLVEQLVCGKVDAPVVASARFGDRARARRVERLVRLVVDVGLRGPVRETDRPSVGRQPDDRLVDRAQREEAHLPPERPVTLAARELRELALATAFELDVVLRHRIVREARGYARAL